jgi:hypothetical protein
MNKQRFTEKPRPESDLERHPGIRQSSGIDNTRNTFEDKEGENTVEGVVLIDTRPDGSIDPNQRGRENE